MKRFIKLLAWVVGVLSAIVLFSEPTAQIFPAQLVAGAVICGLFYIANRQEEVRHA